MKKKISKDFLIKIYKKYSNELINLTEQLRNDFTKFKKFRATFSDFYC